MAARGWRGGTAAVAGLERAVGNCNRGEEKSRVFQVATVCRYRVMSSPPRRGGGNYRVSDLEFARGVE